MDNQDPQENPKKLYVGNLPFSTSEEEIKSMFAPYGEIVDVKLITDRYSGRSKGFAFVEFATEDQARAAVEALHDTDMGGRKMAVNIAKPPRPRENRPQRGGYGGGRGR